jgi:AAA+ superfamily predicted ATPase
MNKILIFTTTVLSPLYLSVYPALATLPVVPPLISIKEMPPIEFKINVDGLGKELGGTAGDIIKESFIRGSESFSNIVGDERFVENLSEGFGNFARSLGSGFDNFSYEARSNLFPSIRDTIRDGLGSVYNIRNVLQIVGPVSLGIVTTLTAYYGTKFAWAWLQKRILEPKPKVLLPGAKIGRWDRIKRSWNRYTSPEAIFQETVKDRLSEIIEKTKIIKEHIRNGKKVTYDNLFLYGEPGTGKTLFATLLADATDMDFAPTTAAALLQKGAGVAYINELVDMAKRSKYGVIIFIDEADAMFVDRNTLSADSEHYQLLNHLLALTGDGSNKFMLVAATNHADVMDEAMGRRFQDRIYMPLPDAITRERLIKAYVNSTLLNQQENSPAFVQKAQELITPTMITNIVQKVDGLSNAEIKDIIQAMRKKSLITKDGLLTMKIVTEAVNQGVEKRQALEQDKAMRKSRLHK